MEKEKKFSRYEMVEVGTHGEGMKKYSLQEWNVFRGKGSDRYWILNKTFKRWKNEARKQCNTYR